MTVTRKGIEFSKRIFYDRLGDDYVYGGTFDPFNIKAGADCSGLVTDQLGAVFFGTAMHWDREGLSTESYRYKPLGPQRIGPFDLVHVAALSDIPADAAVIVNLHHEGAGGPSSHMNCIVDGIYMEESGSYGACTAPQAIPADNPYWNDHWYVPGPIVEDGTPRTEAPVTLRGLDYAGGRPGGGAIKAAGYAFVVRYLSDGGAGLPGKLLTPAETNDLRANGVEIVSNWETTANRMLAGFNGGVADANAAQAQALACGGRKDRPIYFSADWDATEAQQAPINDYLRGAASVIGAENVGIYGGFWPVSRALDAGVARWAWQTHAWSGNNWENRAQLEQLIGTVNVGGVDCDVNISHATDYGQWSISAPPNTGGNVPPPSFQYPSTDEMVKQIWEQLFGYQAQGFEKLFGKTADGKRGKFTVEGIGDIHAKDGA